MNLRAELEQTEVLPQQQVRRQVSQTGKGVMSSLEQRLLEQNRVKIPGGEDAQEEESGGPLQDSCQKSQTEEPGGLPSTGRRVGHN